MKKIAYRFSAATDCLVLAALLLFTISCKDHKAKEVFEKPVAERIQQAINSLREKLKSHSNGWKLHYQPEKTETGHFQFVFRFVNDTEVEIASDFSGEDAALRRSEYSILTGSTVKLSFATGSAIHKLSDADFSPILGSFGSGLKGEFEFLYYGENEQGDLVFRTNRANKTILFKKADKSYVDEIKASCDNLENFTVGRSVYRCLLETKNGREFRSAFEFPYHYNARVANIRERVTNGKDEYLDDGYLTGFGYTPTGIFLDSVKRNSGGYVKNIPFTYNKENGRFVALLKDGAELAIVENTSPFVPAKGLKYFLDPNLTARLVYLPNNADIGWLTTAPFEAIMDQVKPIGIEGPFNLWRQAFLYELNGKTDLIEFKGTASVEGYDIYQRLNFIDNDGKLVIENKGFLSEGDVKPENEEKYNVLMNFLTDPQGFYVENLGRVSRYSNYVFTFTSVKNPTIRLSLYHVN